MLILDGVIFNGWELPEKMPSPGGKHAHNVHKYPGGRRVFDLLGPDDADISWEGRFRSSDALIRIRALDEMRVTGRTVTLISEAYAGPVKVFDFAPEMERVNEVPYRITCTVVTDGEEGGANPATGDIGDVVPAGPMDLLASCDVQIGFAADALNAVDDALAILDGVAGVVDVAIGALGPVTAALTVIGDLADYAADVIDAVSLPVDIAIATAIDLTESVASVALVASAGAHALSVLDDMVSPNFGLAIAEGFVIEPAGLLAQAAIMTAAADFALVEAYGARAETVIAVAVS